MQASYPQAIYLASQSPRRQELLSQIGVQFELVAASIDETPFVDEKPAEYVLRMAQEKALKGWRAVNHDSTPYTGVLAADTSVILGEQILGKPDDTKAAEAMLNALSNRRHQVITSVALKSAHSITLATSITQVKFGYLSQRQINDYCRSGEGLDKAGSYAIQGAAARFVESIEGSYSGVVGLPLYQTGQLLDQHFGQQA